MSEIIGSCPQFQTQACPAAQRIASLRQRLDICRMELAEQRQGTGEQLARGKAEHLRYAHEVFAGRLKELERELAMEREAHQQEVAKLKQEHARTCAALKGTIIEQAQELAMYHDGGPAKGKSEAFSGHDLDKPPPKPRQPRQGHRHGGRKLPRHLPVETLAHPAEPVVCERCGQPRKSLPCAESHEMDFRFEVKLIRHTIGKSVAGCHCSTDLPTVISGARPPKAMHSYLYTDRTWVELLLLKYDLQIPVNRICKLLASPGYEPSTGTISDGFSRLGELLAPLDRGIIEENLQSNLWSADATSFPIVETCPERTGKYWSLWQIQTDRTAVYTLSPTGEASHMQAYFADAEGKGTLLVDRAQVFQTLWFTIAFCWAHVRRDFIKLGRYVSGNRTFAIEWLRRIRKLYHLYQRWKSPAPGDDAAAVLAQLRAHVEEMRLQMEQQLARNPKWPQKRRKVLLSLQKHWPGLIRFLDDPRLPLDTNHVERGFRPIANLRKSSFGCRTEHFGHLTARFFTILRTLHKYNIAPKPYLCAYLQALAQNHGEPPSDIEAWMPWQLSEQVKTRIDSQR